MLHIEPCHVMRIEPDDGAVDQQRTLCRHPETEGPAKKGEAQFPRKIAHDKRNNKPQAQQHRGHGQIATPIDAAIFMVVGYGLVHAASPGASDRRLQLARQLGRHLRLEAAQMVQDAVGFVR